MAAYTSSQSGNWSSSATWGGAGVPSDGDTWTIAATHNVVYNVTTIQTTGLDNGTINNSGRIYFIPGSRMKLNGQINAYGDWIMTSNTRIQIVGGNTADHGIYIRHPTNTTDVHRVEMVGSAGMPETTTTATVAHARGFLSVSNATSFSTGDWISAFKRGLTNVNERTDEGFIVHEVSGSNVYLREFVGPTSTITAAAGSTITVSNANVFREYQSLIFGFGANRNVANVSSINYTTNVITLSSSVTGTVTGQTVYTTGPIRLKNNGDIVRKVATTVTADALSSATTFTVGNSVGFRVGDEIVVDSLLESENYTDERPERRTITAISGTSITVNSSFGYPLLTSAFVVRLTRDCVISTDDSGTQYGYFRIISNNSFNANNKLVMRDVEFRNLGTSVDDTRSRAGPYLAGRYTNDEGHDGVEIEGVTSHRDSARSLTNAGFYLHQFLYRWTVRNCVSFESIQGIWMERGYEMDNMALFNNYSARSESSLFRWQDMRYDYAEFAYNYGNRADDQALNISNSRATGIGVHHNWFRVGQNRGIYSGLHYSSFSVFQNRVEGFFGSSFFAYSGGQGNYLYNEVIQGAASDYQPDLAIARDEYGLDPNQSVISLAHNYELDAVVEYFPGGRRVWVESEKAWKTEHDDDAFSSSVTAGHNEIIFVPSETTVTITCEIKLVEDFVGTPPKLSARELTNRGNDITGNYNPGHAGNPLRSFNTSVNFSSDVLGTYQKQTLTITATKYPKRMSIGVMVQSSDSSEGWFEKPMQIYFDPALPPQEYAGVNKYSASNIYGRSPTTKIIRWGG